jgi:hypothetical protein
MKTFLILLLVGGSVVIALVYVEDAQEKDAAKYYRTHPNVQPQEGW